MPGITAFIVTLGGLYGFSTEIIVGTITAAATLAGVFLNIASSQYQDKQKPDYGDGQSLPTRRSSLSAALFFTERKIIMESKQNKVTIPMKTGVWEWSAKGFGIKKDQKQNDLEKSLSKDK